MVSQAGAAGGLGLAEGGLGEIIWVLEESS